MSNTTQWIVHLSVIPYQTQSTNNNKTLPILNPHVNMNQYMIVYGCISKLYHYDTLQMKTRFMKIIAHSHSTQPQHTCPLAYCFHQRMTQSLLCLQPLKEMQFHAKFQHKTKEDEFPHHNHK